MKKVMNKFVCLGLSMLKLSKRLMYEFWNDYVKRKLCYMDTDSSTLYIKTDDNYKDIAENVETGFDISNYKLECNPIDKPLPKGKNKNVIGLIKDQLGGNFIKFVRLRAKFYSYLINDGSEDQKQKAQKSAP